MVAEFQSHLVLALNNICDGKFIKWTELQAIHLAFYFGSSERYLEIVLIHGQLVTNSLELDSQELQMDRIEKWLQGSLSKSYIDEHFEMSSECKDTYVPCVCLPRTYIFREAFDDWVDKITYL